MAGIARGMNNVGVEGGAGEGAKRAKQREGTRSDFHTPNTVSLSIRPPDTIEIAGAKPEGPSDRWRSGGSMFQATGLEAALLMYPYLGNQSHGKLRPCFCGRCLWVCRISKAQRVPFTPAALWDYVP